jgi:hypothetical protein
MGGTEKGMKMLEEKGTNLEGKYSCGDSSYQKECLGFPNTPHRDSAIHSAYIY